jgi:hypothetical protein
MRKILPILLLVGVLTLWVVDHGFSANLPGHTPVLTIPDSMTSPTAQPTENLSARLDTPVLTLPGSLP